MGLTSSAPSNGASTAVMYVEADGDDGASGLSRGAAKATLTAAVDALGVDGGVIEVGDGTFAPLLIDSTTTLKQGLFIRGQGRERTVISVPSGESGIVISSGGGALLTPNDMHFADLSIVGQAGSLDGINAGDDSWEQFGHLHMYRVRIDGMGRDGMRLFDLNNSAFRDCEVRECGGYGIQVTGNNLDASDTGASVTRGNTSIFDNVSVSHNTLGGYLFDQCGLNYLIQGGEVTGSTTNAVGLTVVPSGATALIHCDNVHFEGNWRSVVLGDGRANGSDARNVKFTNCLFNNRDNLAHDVELNGVSGIDFDGCEYVNSPVAIKSLHANDSFTWKNINAVGGIILLELSDGRTFTSLKGRGSVGTAGPRIVQIASTTSDDSFGATVEYVETLRNPPALIRKMKVGGGSTRIIEQWISTASPEGSITAPPGSICHRINTGELYVKASGTGNTGWQAVGQRIGTTANFTSAGATVNSAGKYAGMQGWNTTTSRPIWATGTTTTSTWVHADGTTAHTPV